MRVESHVLRGNFAVNLQIMPLMGSQYVGVHRFTEQPLGAISKLDEGRFGPKGFRKFIHETNFFYTHKVEQEFMQS